MNGLVKMTDCSQNHMLKDLRQQFDNIDKDGTGLISA